MRQNIMKDYNIQSCLWMAHDHFRQLTQDHHNVSYVKDLFTTSCGWLNINVTMVSI